MKILKFIDRTHMCIVDMTYFVEYDIRHFFNVVIKVITHHYNYLKYHNHIWEGLPYMGEFTMYGSVFHIWEGSPYMGVFTIYRSVCHK